MHDFDKADAIASEQTLVTYEAVSNSTP